MKKQFMFVIAGFLSFLVLMTIGAEQASAQTVTVPAIEIRNADGFLGQYLTVYYGVGSPAAIATAPDQLSLREIKAKHTIQISQGTLSIPATELVKSGIFVAYNLVVFVIHSTPKYTWKNANDSIPEGEELGGMTDSLFISSLKKQEIETMVGADSVLRLDLPSMVQTRLEIMAQGQTK